MFEIMSQDTNTAAAFATSWNNLPAGSVYTKDQFEDWFAPLSKKDAEGKTVLELGCGNASLLVHTASWNPASLEGVDLGPSVISANSNMQQTGFSNFKITQSDLVEYKGEPRDLVYCIGVLHHLKDPLAGFKSVLRNTKPGGKFHCWVYAREGNGLIVYIVDPIRKVASRLPWWFTKYVLATVLVSPYYLYAKLISKSASALVRKLPLYEYSCWIAKRDFLFFRHVAFDQLVTPSTVYLDRETLENWLKSEKAIDPGSTYCIFRNGNSWKFGGTIAR
jgi:SAM-dependent methyltransferase